MSNARDKANIPALNFSSTGIDDNATSTAITIDSSERVGLQYATPSNFNASAQDLIIGGGSGSKGFTIYSGASNNGSIYFADGVSGAEQYRGYIAYAHADNSLRIGTSSSEKMRIDSSGLVRVGNTSHTNSIIGANFDLVIGNESSGASGLAILAPSNENSYLGFFDNNDSGSFRGALHYNHTNDYLRFYTYGSERMRIHSSGNVGIGTSSPGANLHIESSSGETGTLIKTTASDTGVNLTLNGNKTSNTGGIGSIQFQNSGDSVGMIRSFRESANDAGGLSFWTQATGGSNSERMRIDSSGNVGIGTSSPQEKLDIDGNIAISGNTLFEEVTSTAGMPSSAGNKSVNTDYDSTFSLTAGKWLILVNASLQVFQTSGNESGLYLLSLSLGSSAGADNYGLIQKAVLKWGNGSNSYGDNTGGHFPTLTLGSTTTLHTRWYVAEYGTASNFWVRGNLTKIRCIRIG